MAEGERENVKIREIDDLIGLLGNPGRFQALTFVLLAFNLFPVVFHHVCMAFYGYSPPHECRPQSIIPTDVNSSQDLLVLTSYKVVDVNATRAVGISDYVMFQRCYAVVMSQSGVNSSEQCGVGEFRYHLPEDEKTVVVEVRLSSGEFPYHLPDGRGRGGGGEEKTVVVEVRLSLGSSFTTCLVVGGKGGEGEDSGG